MRKLDEVLYFGIENIGSDRTVNLRVHSLHVGYQIALQIAFKGAAFSCASILIRIVDATMLRKLVAGIKRFLANFTVERLSRFLTQVCRLVLLQQEVEVKFLCTIIAVPFRVVRVVDSVIVQRRLCLVGFLAVRKVAVETSDVVGVLIANVIHQGLLQAERRFTLIALKPAALKMSLLLVIQAT